MFKGKKLILLIVFFIGVCILLYPLVSQYWNSKVQSRAIANYEEMLSKQDVRDYSDMFFKADNYNEELYKLEFPLIQYKKISNYFNLINPNNNGMMGYISIDKIKLELPIYHGTSSSILNVAVGHLEGTSLPIGGSSTHSVLSAHRGLPTSQLFTNLNKLEIGDIFQITILDKKLTYQVDNIVTVEPNDISNLKIIPDKDHVTLMTCTPYGINTHRLLVRGIRIENEEEKKLIVTKDAYQINKLIVTLVISLPILLTLIIYIMARPVGKKLYDEEEI